MYSDQMSDSSRLTHHQGLGLPWLVWLLGPVMLLVLSLFSQAAAQELLEIRGASLGADRAQISLRFSGPAPTPSTFAVDLPPRIAMDLPGVSNQVQLRTAEVNQGPVLTVTAVEAGDRTRVVLNLIRNVEFQTRVDGNNLIVLVGDGVSAATATVPTTPLTAPPADPAPVPPIAVAPVNVDTSPPIDRTPPPPVSVPVTTQPLVAAPPPPAPAARPAGVRSAQPPAVERIDFRRGPGGEGRVIVDLSRPGIAVEVQEQAGRVELLFPRVDISDDMERRLDVTDFATPVTTIDTLREPGGDRVRMIISAVGDYDVLSYQTASSYVLEIAPMSEQEREAQRLADQEFVGERLSLNFQDIEVRSVLQLLADFTSLNIVVSDSVGGSITLRLNNVPWDQALDIILRTRGLDKRESGNVMYVAPASEIQERESRELQALREREELAPLRTEYITVNFTQAEDIQRLIRPRTDQVGGDATSRREFSLLSARGSVMVDNRTNTLIVRDTQNEIEAIRGLVARLDVPTRQVLIETRVVLADDEFRRDIGLRLGVSGGQQAGRSAIGVGGTIAGSQGIATNVAGGTSSIPGLADRLNVALPAQDRAGGIGLTLLRPNILLDLELSAAELDGRSQTVASPRVITANGQTATISTGQEIPYNTLDDAGNTVTEFKDAKLETRVTPQITPNGDVIMTIRVTKDEPLQAPPGQEPPIATREVETIVTVANGETVVLGGVYEISSSMSERKVPFLGDVPFIRHFFRSTANENRKAELLIFVTPRVL